MPNAWVGSPPPLTTDAPRRSRAPVRVRRDALEVPRAPFGAPRATLRTREGAMLAPRDALPIRGNALPISEHALRVRRASPGRLGDAFPILRASRRPRRRAVGTPRGTSRARRGAVRSCSDYFTGSARPASPSARARTTAFTRIRRADARRWRPSSTTRWSRSSKHVDLPGARLHADARHQAGRPAPPRHHLGSARRRP